MLPTGIPSSVTSVDIVSSSDSVKECGAPMMAITINNIKNPAIIAKAEIKKISGCLTIVEIRLDVVFLTA